MGFMKKRRFILFLCFGALLGSGFFWRSDKRTLNYAGKLQMVSIDDNGFKFEILTREGTVGDILKKEKINLGERDKISLALEKKAYFGLNIEIRRAALIKIKADGKSEEDYVWGRTVKNVLREKNITLSRLDKTEPNLNAAIGNGETIIVTRINVEEKIEKKEIDFKIIIKEDKKMGWREKKIETKGEKGEWEIKYKITYKDGREISREILDKKKTKEPITQVEIQGVYMELGKAAKGQGTWYAYKGGMFAASTTIPKGHYAKVTSLASGKSVVVQINDYGPQGKGRVIDLDKVAFQKLAPLGAGVIGVKVEEVLN
jgi:hypothetical protein